MVQRIGLYGGTFDPIHSGHINLAVELLERADLDEVWFCPARISPHKQDQHPVSGEERLKMVELAIAGNPKFRAIDLELKREGPSYTVDTLRELSSSYPEREWCLLLGDDCIPSLPRWKNSGEIVELARLLIACRHPGAWAGDHLPEGALKEAVMEGVMSTPLMDIDATRLRSRLKKRLYCEHLISSKVLDFIYSNDLYL